MKSNTEVAVALHERDERPYSYYERNKHNLFPTYFLENTLFKPLAL